MQEYRNQRSLPVMAMDDIRTEADNRQYRKHCLGEKAELLDIPQNITIQLFAMEKVLIVNVIIPDSFIFAGHNAYIEVTQLAQIHIAMSKISKPAAEFLRNAGIVRQDDTHIIFALVQRFRKCAHNVCQAAGFYKRHAFRCSKQYIFHFRCPPSSFLPLQPHLPILTAATSGNDSILHPACI